MILAKTNARTKAENRTRAIQASEGVKIAPVCSDNIIMAILIAR